MVFDCAEKSRTLHSAFVDHEDMIRPFFRFHILLAGRRALKLL